MKLSWHQLDLKGSKQVVVSPTMKMSNRVKGGGGASELRISAMNAGLRMKLLTLADTNAAVRLSAS